MTLRQKIHNKIILTIEHLQRFTERVWYPPLLGLLALIDLFIIVIPTDGMLISSAMLRPKNWLSLSLYVAIGSSLGISIFYYIVDTHGLPWILDIYPGINQGSLWIWSESFFQKYGLFLVFVVAAAPLMQHPTIILASLAHTPFLKVIAVVLSGRILKYLVLAYISSHSPRLLSKLWGTKGELDELGIHIDSKIHQPKVKN